jgi:hypothetical protein
VRDRKRIVTGESNSYQQTDLFSMVSFAEPLGICKRLCSGFYRKVAVLEDKSKTPGDHPELGY